MVNIVGMVSYVADLFASRRYLFHIFMSKLIYVFQQSGETRNMVDIKPRITEETNDKSKIWKLTEINEPSQCRSLRLPENMRVHKVLVSYIYSAHCCSAR